MQADEKFETYAILEIMGHQKYAGLVTEKTIGGTAFVRVDVPEIDGRPAFSKLFGAGSIFCITPVSKEVAEATAAGLRQAPLNTWDFPEAMRKKIHAMPARSSDDELHDAMEGDNYDDL